MSHKIAIRRVESGEVRVYEDARDWRLRPTPDLVPYMTENISPDAYWWTDGNGACDCNRAYHFGFAADRNRPVHEVIDELDASGESRCGEGRYAIEYVQLENGKYITLEEGGTWSYLTDPTTSPRS